MATYYHHGNPEIQGGDGLQTLILMNPGYVGFSDAQSSNSLVFLNSFAGGNNLASASTLPHAPQQFVGVPVSHAAGASQDPPPPSVNAHQDLSQLHGFLPRTQYNLWNSVDPSAVARDAPRPHQQGLSLSLSPQQPAAAAAAYGSSYSAAERDAASAPPAGTNTNGMRISGRSSSPASGITNGVSGMQSVLLSSKYLKAAQQLLDEVVNVGNGVKTESSAKRSHGLTRTVGESSASGAAAGDILMIGGDGAERGSTELTTAERQEIQMKKAKLMGMLEEVEQRYRQYHQQMRMVISTFEQMAGIGSAKTYTALALETISKQFRCLKDAIIAQIRGANKCLGHDESSGARIEGSRLKFVDHQLRQQRALQQLGMMPHNAWRPQRGLPERSVSVLRAWLFEHFLHPYPKDSDKHMLAKQTGLTRSQVSNWFINARVRLWKPMVEEMYMEELKEQESNHQLPDDKSSKSEEDSGSKVTAADKSMIPENPGSNNFISNHQDNSLPPQPMISMSAAVSSSAASHSGDGYATPAMDGITFTAAANTNTSTTRGSPKKRGGTESLLLSPNGGVVPPMNMDVKPGDAMGDLHMKFGGGERQSRDEYSLMSTNYIGGFGSYPMNEIGRFDADPFPPPPRFSGNGSVSLTLGLPHCENGLSLSGAHHQNFIPNHGMQLGRRVDMGDPTGEYCLTAAAAPPSHSAATPFEDLNLQNRKPFAAQLLPDFVA